MKLFELKEGDKFLFNNKKLTLVRYERKRMPTLGIVLNAVAKDETGKESNFIKNWDITNDNKGI